MGHLSFPQPIKRLTGKNLKEFVRENVDNSAMVMTDDFKAYRPLRRELNHKNVNHTLRQHVNGPVHTNAIEGYFSLLKREITGIFHHVSQKHLSRYLSEFDFRYNMRRHNNGTLVCRLLNRIEGKKLLYREPLSPLPG